MNIKDPFTRRAFVSGAAKSFLGVGAFPMLAGLGSPALASGQPVNRVGGKAKAVIYLYMSGGMSHLDTFDTKP